MKRTYFAIVCLFILFQSCKNKPIPEKEIYNKEFNWTITIPKNFETVSPEQWMKMQNKGAAAIEKAYGEKIENRTTTIFVFKSDELNYFESNWQPFDTLTDGNYSESCKNVNEVLYQTFITQMQGVKVDTASSIEKIDGLDFQTLKFKVAYPNKMVLNGAMFSRLFDKKEFSVSVTYVDKAKGEAMLNSWRNSTFTKK